jgi:hypothetical protein
VNTPRSCVIASKRWRKSGEQATHFSAVKKVTSEAVKRVKTKLKSAKKTPKTSEAHGYSKLSDAADLNKTVAVSDDLPSSFPSSVPVAPSRTFPHARPVKLPQPATRGFAKFKKAMAGNKAAKLEAANLKEAKDVAIGEYIQEYIQTYGMKKRKGNPSYDERNWAAGDEFKSAKIQPGQTRK